MKKLIIVLVLLLLTMPALAEEEKEKNKVSKHEHCEEYSEFANVVMLCRQQGTMLSEAMTWLDPVIVEKDGLDMLILRGILMDAYRRPKHFSSALQEEEINEYENFIYLECMTEWPSFKK